MNNPTTTQARAAVVAAALHRVFATAAHAPDSLELWLAITLEADARLSDTAEPPQWMPVFAVYRKQRTEAEYHLETGSMHITSGPLTGTIYAAPADAAEAITTAHHGTGTAAVYCLPTWRLDHPLAPNLVLARLMDVRDDHRPAAS